MRTQLTVETKEMNALRNVVSITRLDIIRNSDIRRNIIHKDWRVGIKEKKIMG